MTDKTGETDKTNQIDGTNETEKTILWQMRNDMKRIIHIYIYIHKIWQDRKYKWEKIRRYEQVRWTQVPVLCGNQQYRTIRSLATMKVDHFHGFSTSMLVYPEVPEVTPKEAGVIATTTVDPISSLTSRLYHLPLVEIRKTTKCGIATFVSENYLETSRWFDNFWWFLMFSDGFWWVSDGFLMVSGGFWWFLIVFWWFLMVSDGLWLTHFQHKRVCVSFWKDFCQIQYFASRSVDMSCRPLPSVFGLLKKCV